MDEIFVSHSHTDDVFVDKLVRSLQDQRIDTFVDHQDIQVGEHWPSRVQQALRAADKMIAVISDNSVISRNCMDEWDFFLDWKGEARKEIIPIRLSDVEPYYRLTSFHYVDFRTGYDDPLAQLIARLRVDQPVPAALPPQPLTTPDDERPLNAALRERYPLLRRREKSIGLATGNIAEIVGADVLVNSENDRLALDVASKDPRRSTRSISAAIRSFGALWNERGHMVEDVIKNEVNAAIRAHNLTPPVPITTVIDTSGGSLETLGVRRIMHAVTVSGTRRADNVASFATPMQLARTVENVLRRMDALNLGNYASQPLKTVVFPIFTTGREKRPFEQVAPGMVARAVEHLEYEPTQIETVYFVAYRQKDLNALQAVFDASPDVNPIPSTA